MKVILYCRQNTKVYMHEATFVLLPMFVERVDATSGQKLKCLLIRGGYISRVRARCWSYCRLELASHHLSSLLRFVPPFLVHSLHLPIHTHDELEYHI